MQDSGKHKRSLVSAEQNVWTAFSASSATHTKCFATGESGFVLLCVGRKFKPGAPLTALAAFSDPSGASPGWECPTGWEMLGNGTRGCDGLGTNGAGGCVHLCVQRKAGAPAITRLAGMRGSGAGCPAGSQPVMAAGGAVEPYVLRRQTFPFDPVTLPGRETCL